MIWQGVTSKLFSEPTDPRVYEILGTSVSISGALKDGRMRVLRNDERFSDLDISVEKISQGYDRDITLAMPRACVSLSAPRTEIPDAGEITLMGTVVERSIAGDGYFNYDVQLLNGTVWRGLPASKMPLEAPLEIGFQVEVRIPTSCVRPFATRVAHN